MGGIFGLGGHDADLEGGGHVWVDPEVPGSELPSLGCLKKTCSLQIYSPLPALQAKLSVLIHHLVMQGHFQSN